MTTQADTLRARLLDRARKNLQSLRDQMEGNMDRTYYQLALRKGRIQQAKIAVTDIEEIFKDIDSVFDQGGE